MADHINKSYRVPVGTGLPNVGEGDKLRPKFFNRLSEGIDRNTLQPGKGVKVKKTASSTTLSIQTSIKAGHAFQVYSLGAYITIKMGCFFSTRQIPFNEWRQNSSVNWCGDYDYTAGLHTNSHPKGAEIMINVEGDTIENSSHISSADLDKDLLLLPFKKGLYYIKIEPWTAPIIAPTNGVMSAVSNLNATVKSVEYEGLLMPTLLHATPAEVEEMEGELYYPIAFVDEHNQILQCISSDIYDVGLPAFPFEGTRSNTEYLKFYPGTVNRVMPKLNGQYLDAQPPPEVELQEGIYAVKATWESGSYFPKESEVLYASADWPSFPEDTNTESYYPLYSVAKNGNKWVVTLLHNKRNLAVTRVKAGDNTAAWFWQEL